MRRTTLTRRYFIRAAGAASLAIPMALVAAAESPSERPNVILCMTDDQGWGDTGYNGHPHLKTPHLDAMAREGIRFTRFYSAAPVCSPTRGSCLTGRHPHRYGVLFANNGHMRPKEITLAEALKTLGYATGHFGKWHLGTLTKTVKESNRGGPRGAHEYSPPWENGFDVCFSTEAKVPTYNPMVNPETGKRFGTHYWTGPGQMVTDHLAGDDARVIMDRAIPFIEKAVRKSTPFLAVIWFHTPHKPVVASLEHRALYADLPEKARHYLGCLTAMDQQIGRLRTKLAELGVADDTLLWFCSDNGPEGREYDGTNGSAGPLRGRKRSLFEGGVRVPGLLVWPRRVKQPRIVDMPCSTSDYFPTILDALGLRMKDRPQPVDGISLMPLVRGEMQTRPSPICFESKKQIALIDNRFKLISSDDGKSFMLFDLVSDPGEAHDLAATRPRLVREYEAAITKWRISCTASRAGKDY